MASFGRLMQVLFVKRSLARMRRLVDAEMITGRHGAGVPLLSDRLAIRPEEDA